MVLMVVMVTIAVHNDYSTTINPTKQTKPCKAGPTLTKLHGVLPCASNPATVKWLGGQTVLKWSKTTIIVGGTSHNDSKVCLSKNCVPPKLLVVFLIMVMNLDADCTYHRGHEQAHVPGGCKVPRCVAGPSDLSHPAAVGDPQGKEGKIQKEDFVKCLGLLMVPRIHWKYADSQAIQMRIYQRVTNWGRDPGTNWTNLIN